MAELQKVSKGQPLQISAATFNTFIDVAQDFRNRQRSMTGDAGLDARPPGTVIVRNDSGADVGRFGVLAVSGVVFTPTDNLGNFQAGGWAFKTVLPTGPADRMVIALEPIAQTKCGRALAYGMTAVQLEIVGEADLWASPKAGYSDRLITSSSGTAAVYYKESGTGLKWGVVMIPAGGAAGVKYAKITGHTWQGPPWLYDAVQVEHDGSNSFGVGNFPVKAGGDALSWKLINVQELGAAGLGVNPIPSDSIVVYQPMGSMFSCSVSYYRGTF